MVGERGERLLAFRGELIQLYRRFEADIEGLCKRHGVKIDFWYNPSMIPQPKFIIDGVGFDADELYDEKGFELLAQSSRARNVKGARSRSWKQ